MDYTQSRTTDNTSLPPSHCHCTSLQQWTIHSQGLQTTHHCHPVTITAQACNSGLYTVKDYRQHITATQSLSLHKPATVDYTQSRTTDNTSLPPSHYHCTSLQQWTIHSQGLQTTHHCHPVTITAQACNSGLYTVKDYRQHTPSHCHCTSLQQWTIHSQGLQTTHHCHPVTITAQACNSGLYTVKDYRQHITATQSLSLHKPATVDYTQSRTTDNTSLPPSHCHCTSLQQWTIHSQGLQTTHHCHPVTVTAQACNSGLYTVKDYRQHITATQSLSLHKPATVDYTQSRTTDNTSLPPSHCHCTSLQQWTIHSQGLQTTHHCHPVTVTAQACNSGLYTVKDYRQHITATQSLSLHKPATVDYTQSRTTDNTSLPPSHYHCTSLQQWTIHSQGLQTTHHCHPVTVTAQACNSGLYTVKDYRQHITATQSLSLHKPATVDYTQSRTTDNTSLPPSHCHCTSLQQWTIHSQGLQTTHHCHPVTITAQACNSGLYTVKDYRQHTHCHKQSLKDSLHSHYPATVDYTQSRTTDNTSLPPSHCHCTSLQQWTIHSQGLQTTHHCHPVTITAQACNSGLYTVKDYRQHITATQSLSLHKPATVDYTQSRTTDNTSLPPSHCHCTSLQQWTIHSQGLQTTHHCHPVTQGLRQHMHKPATVDYTQSRTTDNTSLPPSHYHCTSLQQWTIHSQGLQTTHHCHPVTVTAQACNSGLYTVKDYRQHITATQSLSLHKPATVDYTQSRTTDNTSLPPSHYHCTSLQQWTIHSQGLQTTHHCHPVTVTAQACNSGLYTVKDYRQHITATQSLSLHKPATVDYTQSRTTDNTSLPPSHYHCTSLQQWTIHSQGLQTTHHCHPVTVTAQACNSGLYTVKDYRQHTLPPSHCTSLQQWTIHSQGLQTTHATQSLHCTQPATVDYTQSRTTDNTSLPPSHCHCTSLQQWTIHSQGLQTTHHCHPVTITAQACNSGLYTVKDYRQHITATQSLSLHKPATVDYTQSRTTDNTSLPPSHCHCTSLQQWTIHSQGLQTTHHCHPVTVTAQACNSGLYTVKDYRQHITATVTSTSLQQWTIHSQGLQTTHHCHPVTVTAQACNSGLYTVKDYRQHITATQSLSLHKPATVDYTQSRTTDNTSLPPSHYHCTSLQQWTIHSQGLQTTHHCHPVTVTAQACNSGLYTVKDYRQHITPSHCTAQACNSGLYTVKDYRQHITATQSLSLHKPATVDYTQSRTTDNTSLPPSHCHCTSLQQWTIHSQGLQTTHHCHPVTITAQACNSGLYTVKDYRQHITATQSLSLHKPATVDYTQSRTTDNTSLPPSHCHCTSLQQWTIHSQGLQTTHHCHPVTVTAQACNSGLYTVKDYRQHITATQSLSLHKPATVDYTQSRTTDNTSLPPSHCHCTSLQQWTIHSQGLQTTHHCHPVTAQQWTIHSQGQ